MSATYDEIGQGYRAHRRPDPRIAAALRRAIGDARSVLNVGAGTGSYEPGDCNVVAVEPSSVMIAQRPAGAAPAVRAGAEALPFESAQFDCALAVLTIHHWTQVRAGLEEMRRVARRRIVLLTWIGFVTPFWLVDYFPDIEAIDQRRFPSLDQLRAWLGPVRAVPLPIPHDCSDGFLCAYWQRPHAYLNAEVRRAISTFSRIGDYDESLARLRDDLANGRWNARYGFLSQRQEMDFGYRIVTVDK